MGLTTTQAKRIGAQPLAHTTVVTALIIAIGFKVGPGSYYGYLMTIALLYGIATIGLNIPAGMLGQLSLGQGAAMALGGYTAAILIVNDHWPLLPALVACLAVGFVVGVLMAIPAARLGVIGLAVVTLGFTLIVSDGITGLSGLTGGPNGKSGVEAPLISGADLTSNSLFVVVTITCALAYLVHWKIRVSRFGRSCLAVRDEELGATALGISSYRHIVAGFAIGSAVGALSGGLYGVVATIVTPDLFGIQLSVLILLMVIFGGPGTQFGPVVGATVIGLLPILLASHPTFSVYAYGLILIVAMRLLPHGVIRRTAAPVQSGARLLRGRRIPRPTAGESSAHAPAAPDASVTAAPDASVPAQVILQTKDVSRSFGGVIALSNADLTIHRGEVVAVIGSNGSGKTTLLNVVCGYYRAQGGQVLLADRDITLARPRVIANLGVSRTFQVPKVFPSLSIEEHLALARSRAAHPRSQVFEDIAQKFLGATGLLDNPGQEARTLSQGALRFLELAVAILRAPDVLLLDEPAAGLSAEEMGRLKELIEDLSACSVGVALVEHHLDWVRSIADRIIVMHLGEQIWAGAPDDLLRSEIVRDAYLLGVANE